MVASDASVGQQYGMAKSSANENIDQCISWYKVS